MSKNNSFRLCGWILLVILLTSHIGSLVLVSCQDWGSSQDLQPQHPKDLTEQELQEWYEHQDKIEEALEEIDDPHTYKRKEYECNKFSDYTANELAKKGFKVKRAMTEDFDGEGQHHWVIIIVKVGDKEIWVPVECTPPEGQKQKQEGRLDQWPRIPVQPDESGRSKFDKRYFKGVKVKDVNISDLKNDLRHIYTGSAGQEYFGYLDVEIVHLELTSYSEELDCTITVMEEPVTLDTIFYNFMFDRNSDAADNSQDFATNGTDTMYSVIYDSIFQEWRIERSIHQTWGWDVLSTEATWGIASSWPGGEVTIQILIPLTELSDIVSEVLSWKVVTETFNGIPIGDFVPDTGLAHAYIHPDISPPVLYVDSPKNQTYTVSEIDLNVLANEVTESFSYNLNNGGNVTFSGNTTLEAAYGFNQLVVYGIDLEGNVGSSFVTFEIKFQGDLDENGEVNILDVSLAAFSYGSHPGEDRWNIVCDLNHDEVIDIIDVSIVAMDYGKTV